MIIDFNKIANNPKNNPYIFKDLDVDTQFRHSTEVIFHSRNAIDEKAIQQSINNLFTFRIGERPLKPEYGNTLYEYLYEPINPKTTSYIKNSILTTLSRWEPRIDVLDIEVRAVPDRHEYWIVIYYIIPALKNKRVTFTKAITQLSA